MKRIVLKRKSELQNKLNELLNGNKLESLELDFIGSESFSDHYEFKSVLGKGGFSVVLKILEKNTSCEYAMKVIYKKL